MGTFLHVLLGAMFFYYILIYWLVYGRGEFKFAYNPIIAKLLIWNDMYAITLGARCYSSTPNGQLFWIPSALVHERFHYENQWRKYPYTFLFRYLYYNIKYGYDKNPMEQEDRIISGEETR